MWRSLCDSYFVRLCIFYHEAFHVESYLSPCPPVLSVLFIIVITSLGERRAGIYASRTFVCLSCIDLFVFFLVSSIVFVTFPGLFILL